MTAPTRLSKKYFMSLDEDLFISSGVTDDQCKPVFAQEVWPLSIRSLQWQIILERRVNHRHCYVWPSKAAFEEDYFKLYLGEMMKAEDK